MVDVNEFSPSFEQDFYLDTIYFSKLLNEIATTKSSSFLSPMFPTQQIVAEKNLQESKHVQLEATNNLNFRRYKQTTNTHQYTFPLRSATLLTAAPGHAHGITKLADEKRYAQRQRRRRRSQQTRKSRVASSLPVSVKLNVSLSARDFDCSLKFGSICSFASQKLASSPINLASQPKLTISPDGTELMLQFSQRQLELLRHQFDLQANLSESLSNSDFDNRGQISTQPKIDDKNSEKPLTIIVFRYKLVAYDCGGLVSAKQATLVVQLAYDLNGNSNGNVNNNNNDNNGHSDASKCSVQVSGKWKKKRKKTWK